MATPPHTIAARFISSLPTFPRIFPINYQRNLSTLWRENADPAAASWRYAQGRRPHDTPDDQAMAAKRTSARGSRGIDFDGALMGGHRRSPRIS
jgi:hypothetical protein